MSAANDSWARLSAKCVNVFSRLVHLKVGVVSEQLRCRSHQLRINYNTDMQACEQSRLSQSVDVLWFGHAVGCESSNT